MSEEMRSWKDDPRLVAYGLEEWSELSAEDVAEIERALERDPDCREVLEGVRSVGQRLALAYEASSGSDAERPVLASDARAAIALAARRGGAPERRWMPVLVGGFAAAAAAGLAYVGLGGLQRSGEHAETEPQVALVEQMAANESGAAPMKGSSGVRGRTEVGAPLLRTPGPSDASSGEVLGTSAESGPDVGRTITRGQAAAEDGEEWRPVFEIEHDGEIINRKRAYGTPGQGDSKGRHEELRELLDDFNGRMANRDQSGLLGREAGAEGAPVVFESAEQALDSVGAVAPAPERVAPAEAPFVSTAVDSFSTFSIDVDTASYSAARAAIQAGRVPDPDAIRVEEFVNYFSYGDAAPADGKPFAVHTAVGSAPWSKAARLVRIGVKARSVALDERRRANLVFLVDVSGSMKRETKLPLVKRALAVLTESLHPEDRVAIAVYAAAEGLALDSTPAMAREAILQGLERLEGGGSTNAGAGIELAYGVAREHFIEGGINRVVLCTDGDFNVGITEPGALEELIAKEAASGVELTVLGFGGSSSGDARMEALSNRGNGNYAAIDSELEARKVLAANLGGTLETVASDVKIQVAWNPERVAAFRLVGYENRRLEHADFLDDRVDAGEIGSGHGVTALFEFLPAVQSVESELDLDLELAIGEPGVFRGGSDSICEVRLRYKFPGRTESVGFEVQAEDSGAMFAEAPDDLRFAAAVASFAQLLRGAPEVKGVTAESIRTWALESKGEDPGGLREGFVQLLNRWIQDH